MWNTLPEIVRNAPTFESYLRWSNGNANDSASLQACCKYLHICVYDLCLKICYFFFITCNIFRSNIKCKSLKTHFGLHNPLMILSRLEIINPR